jgi:hypothetical protein
MGVIFGWGVIATNIPIVVVTIASPTLLALSHFLRAFFLLVDFIEEELVEEEL